MPDTEYRVNTEARWSAAAIASLLEMQRRFGANGRARRAALVGGVVTADTAEFEGETAVALRGGGRRTSARRDVGELRHVMGGALHQDPGKSGTGGGVHD